MGIPLRILAAEDSPEDIAAIARTLRSAGYGPVIQQVVTAEAMEDGLAQQSWDLVLADHSLPRFGALAALRLLKDRGVDIPLLVVSDAIGEEAAAAVMRAGARDCVHKNNLTRLVPAIERELRHAASRRAVANRLRESEDRFRIVADTAPVLIRMSGPDALCTFVNKPWLDFRGRTLDQELGDGWTRGIHPDDVKACLETYLGAFRARRSFRMEYRLQRYDGEFRWVLDTGVPRCHPEGSFAGYVGSCLDITDRIRSERDPQAARQRLLEAETEKKRFYSEMMRVVTRGRFRLADYGEVPTEGRLALSLALTDQSAYAGLREDLRTIARQAGMGNDDAEDLVVAVGEAAANAIEHAAQGECLVFVTSDRVVARVRDQGPGIRADHLPAAILVPGFSTKVSLGMGYTIMLRLTDRLWLATGLEGTIVQLEKWIHAPRSPEPIVPAVWDYL